MHRRTGAGSRSICWIPGELPHGTVLNHVMKLNDYQDPWYNIADSYWEKALDELGIR